MAGSEKAVDQKILGTMKSGNVNAVLFIFCSPGRIALL
jgi:hypothetical protein